jgi:putative oxidoreductase
MKKFNINWSDDSNTIKNQQLKDVGLLFMRLGVGVVMLFTHGSDKLVNFSSISPGFPDPLGLGSTFSLILVVFAEFFCSLAIIFGIFTRYAAIPLFFNMLVAAFFVLNGDPWAKKEVAIVYMIIYLALFFTGGGRYSIDMKLFKNKKFLI